MSKEKCIDKMTYVRVSCGNVERIEAVSKKGETFDDVVTKLLDFYEDLRRQDWINLQNNENQYKEQVKNKRQCYTSLSSL
jgi:hypothetical protein